MGEERNTAWAEKPYGGWERFTHPGWASMRLMVFEMDGGWTFVIDVMRGLANGRVYDPWDRENFDGLAAPILPTREAAQAAAEAWAREFARGLLGAVGEERKAADKRDVERGLIG